MIHHMDGRIKLLCMILLTVAAGIAISIWDLALLTLVLVMALRVSRLPIKNVLTDMRYFLFLIGFVLVMKAWSVPGTPVLTSLPSYSPTWEGLISGLMYGWRLILILFLSTLLAGTTSLTVLKNVIEWFLSPIPFVPAARVATMFSLTFVLIPLIFDQASEMREAQRARGIEGRKSLIARIKFLIFPLLLHTFRGADEMVLAMESRCYSEARTRLDFQTDRRDWLLLIFSGFICLLIFSHRF